MVIEYVAGTTVKVRDAEALAACLRVLPEQALNFVSTFEVERMSRAQHRRLPKSLAEKVKVLAFTAA